MPSRESYKAGYLGSLEKKLFMLSDHDGGRNQEVSKVTRLLQLGMGGLAPFGSSVAGYGTREKHGKHNAP